MVDFLNPNVEPPFSVTRGRFILEARYLYASKGYKLIDVEYDGNCGCHAIAPLYADFLRRATSVAEIRRLFVYTLDSTSFDRELEYELGFEANDASRDEILDDFINDTVYLPPKLLAQAAEHLTKKRVRVHMFGSGTHGILYEPDGEGSFDIELLYIHQLEHIVRLEKADVAVAMRHAEIEGAKTRRKRAMTPLALAMAAEHERVKRRRV